MFAYVGLPQNLKDLNDGSWVKASLEYVKKLQEWFGQKRYLIAVDS